MKTEQELVDPVVEGGNKIKGFALRIQNYNLVIPAMHAADLIKASLEFDSSNSDGEVSNDDAASAVGGWSMVKKEYELGKEFKDMAKGKHERQHWIVVPSDNEVAMCSNIPFRRFNYALLNFIYVLMGSDEARMQFWIGDRAEGRIDKAILQVDRVMEIYIAPGDERIQAPYYPTGTLEPSTNLGMVNLREPGTSQPPAGIADVPDVASIARSPGKGK